MTTEAPAGWLTIEEASSRLGRTRQRVHQLLRTGALEGCCIPQPRGRVRWAIDPASVETRLAEQPSRRACPEIDFAALPAWLSIFDVSRAVGVTEAHIAKLIRERRLRAARRNRRRWVRRADLQAFVVQRELERTRKSERGRPAPETG